MKVCPHCGFTALKTDEAAERLGVAKQTIHNYIFAGRFDGVETESVPGGRRYWIPLSEIERYEEEAKSA